MHARNRLSGQTQQKTPATGERPGAWPPTTKGLTTVPKATARPPEPHQRAEAETNAPRLPERWKPFESAPASDGTRHWYATAPFSAEALREQYDDAAAGLVQTVDGPSRRRLCVEAWSQDEQYKRLVGDEA